MADGSGNLFGTLEEVAAEGERELAPGRAAMRAAVAAAVAAGPPFELPLRNGAESGEDAPPFS